MINESVLRIASVTPSLSKKAAEENFSFSRDMEEQQCTAHNLLFYQYFDERSNHIKFNYFCIRVILQISLVRKVLQ